MHFLNKDAPYNAASKVLYKDKLTVMYRRKKNRLFSLYDQRMQPQGIDNNWLK